jgi:hypothetical protein
MKTDGVFMNIKYYECFRIDYYRGKLVENNDYCKSSEGIDKSEPFKDLKKFTSATA